MAPQNKENIMSPDGSGQRLIKSKQKEHGGIGIRTFVTSHNLVCLQNHKPILADTLSLVISNAQR